VVSALWGDTEVSLDWLEESVKAGRLYHGWDMKEPAFENIRNHPEFQQLMDRMKAEVEEQSERVRAMEERGELRLVPEGP
jgi:hypothetical protein